MLASRAKPPARPSRPPHTSAAVRIWDLISCCECGSLVGAARTSDLEELVTSEVTSRQSMNKMRTAFISSDSELNNPQLGSSEQGDESMLMLVSNYRSSVIWERIGKKVLKYHNVCDLRTHSGPVQTF